MADEGNFVIGLDLGGTKIELAAATPAGRIIATERMATQPTHGAEQAMARALRKARRLANRAAATSGGSLAGVGVSTMGLTHEDRVDFAPNVPGWAALSIPPMVREAFPQRRVTVDNDVKAAAWAEIKWGALADCGSGIYLNLGTGIATALTLGPHVLRGAHSMAGEIAYGLRSVDEREGAAAGRAPLEEFVGGSAIERRARDSLDLGVAELFERASTDRSAMELVEETLAEITYHTTNLAIAFDPDCVVVGGGLMRAKATVLPAIERRVRMFAPFPPRIKEARFVPNGGVMGAIALATEPIDYL